MANKFLTAAVAGAMLVPSAKAQENVGVQDIEDSTKVEIVDALSRENTNSEKEISLEDAKLQLKIDDAFNNLSSKEKKIIRRIAEHYGEEKFKLGLTNIVKEVENNPDNYGTFDSKGGYSLNEDAMKDLLKSEYPEYFKDNVEDLLFHIATYCAFIYFCLRGLVKFKIRR